LSEKVRNFAGNKYGSNATNADGLDSVRSSTVGGEALGEIKGNLDDGVNGGPSLQVLEEGRIVANFGMDLTMSNIFKQRSVRFVFMVVACKLWKGGRENLLTVDHHEVVFIQRGREVVKIGSHGVEEVIYRIVVRCEDEQLGAFLIATDLSSHVVRQSGSHSDDITDIIWRKFVAPGG